MGLPDPEHLAKMHQYFAVECNNRGWELAELASRSAEETEELRNNAHAAAFHWSKVGTPVNEMRARLLLAEVAAHEGKGEEALLLATECCRFFRREGTEWDRAFGTLELAYAQAVCSNGKEVAPLLKEASSRAEQLAEKGDREFFTQCFERISGLIEALPDSPR
jgi:hypothetical protein